MKKQYDLTKLTDELSTSVFFQKPEQVKQLAHEQNQRQEERQQPALATSQHIILSTKQQDAESGKPQRDKTTKQQADLAGKQQDDKATSQQSNKALKRFTSYLQEPTLRALRVLAAQKDRNDYDVLQEAVEQYLEREQATK